MLELDIMLQGFLSKGYDDLSEQNKKAFEQLLTYPDQMLLEYLLGRLVPSDGEEADVVGKIRDAALH